MRTHGLSGTRIDQIYRAMRRRCFNANCPEYRNYGARGITVCDEWKEPQAFYDWAIANGYNDDLTIDRIDNNGNYEPSNCRWVDRFTQANNTRANHFMTFNGKTQTVAQWARELGINHKTLETRVSYGWSDEKALTYELNSRVDSKKNRKIDQFDCDGNYIKTFNTIISASKEVGVSTTCIHHVLNGNKKTTGGYRWRYAS